MACETGGGRVLSGFALPSCPIVVSSTRSLPLRPDFGHNSALDQIAGIQQYDQHRGLLLTCYNDTSTISELVVHCRCGFSHFGGDKFGVTLPSLFASAQADDSEPFQPCQVSAVACPCQITPGVTYRSVNWSLFDNSGPCYFDNSETIPRHHAGSGASRAVSNCNRDGLARSNTARADIRQSASDRPRRLGETSMDWQPVRGLQQTGHQESLA